MKAGTLYIVATPIGNLEDITLRALRTLKSVGLIAAEDTRRSARLLKHYDIFTPMTSYHDFSQPKRRETLLRTLLDGTDIALISDAGTPGISDPGYRLIGEALSKGIEVMAVPGPSVLTAALSIAGLPTDAFYFNGYLPNRPGPRKERLRSLRTRRETLVLYEAPHRIPAALRDMMEILGDRRRVAILREMTKLHEETFRGTLKEAHHHFGSQEKIRGEFTLVIEGASEEGSSLTVSDLPKEIERVIREQEVTRKEAVRIVAEAYGIPKREVYRASIRK
jgi:16S rRNA (cytidine1402-2'-O)-methyltransferase